MALPMPGPVKHPKTGTYQLRVRVPADIRALIGKGEVVESLGTKDPQLAKPRYLQARAKLEAKWANLRRGHKRYTERETDELVVPIFHRWFDEHRDNPTQQKRWETALFQQLWAPPDVNWQPGTDFSYRQFLRPNIFKIYQMQKECEDLARSFTDEHGLVVDEIDLAKFARAIARAIQGATLNLEKITSGEKFSNIHTSIMAARDSDPVVSAEVVQDPVPFEALVNGWAAEKNPTKKTAYEWRRVIRQLCAAVGHDDARRVTTADLNVWKSELIKGGMKSKTIRDAQLAPIRAIFRWANENGHLQHNPAEKVSIAVKIKPGESRRGFTDEEAAIILRAAGTAINPVCRWVPWICAYTGARVSEVCQLRKEDILKVENIWCLKFDPAAGSLKNRNSERIVPVHAALIDDGFLHFVDSITTGPIFSELPPDKWGNRGGNGTKILGRWVRSIGIIDERLAPNHSWRHRLKTLARRHGLASDLVDAICGHSPKSVGDRYGEYPVDALLRELEKIPKIACDK